MSPYSPNDLIMLFSGYIQEVESCFEAVDIWSAFIGWE